MAASASGSENVSSAARTRGAGRLGRPGRLDRHIRPGRLDRHPRLGSTSGWRRAADSVRQAPAQASEVLTRARWRWGSSLQLRVVSTTLVVSAIVVSLLGFFLMQEINANLLRPEVAAASTQASNGLNFARSQPGASAQPGAASKQLMYGVVASLQSSGENPSDEYGVAVGVDRPSPPDYSPFA